MLALLFEGILAGSEEDKRLSAIPVEKDDATTSGAASEQQA
jgi:hypothetical protein